MYKLHSWQNFPDDLTFPSGEMVNNLCICQSPACLHNSTQLPENVSPSCVAISSVPLSQQLLCRHVQFDDDASRPSFGKRYFQILDSLSQYGSCCFSNFQCLQVVGLCGSILPMICYSDFCSTARTEQHNKHPPVFSFKVNHLASHPQKVVLSQGRFSWWPS